MKGTFKNYFKISLMCLGGLMIANVAFANVDLTSSPQNLNIKLGKISKIDIKFLRYYNPGPGEVPPEAHSWPFQIWQSRATVAVTVVEKTSLGSSTIQQLVTVSDNCHVNTARDNVKSKCDGELISDIASRANRLDLMKAAKVSAAEIQLGPETFSVEPDGLRAQSQLIAAEATSDYQQVLSTFQSAAGVIKAGYSRNVGTIGSVSDDARNSASGWLIWIANQVKAN